MRSKLRRIFHTSVFYLHFIIWGPAFTFIVIPVVKLVSIFFPGAGKAYGVIVHYFYRSLIALLQLVRAIRIESFQGIENLYVSQPCIYISNHRTMLDVLIYLCRLNDTNCLIKAGPSHKRIIDTRETETVRGSMPGWWGPFIISSLKILGYIRMPAEKNDMAGLKQAIEGGNENE